MTTSWLHIDLNADLGEEITDDEALLGIVTSASVACGFHAGTDETMRQVCDEAVRRGVRIGAQVSYADREGFGRRRLDVPARLLTEQVAEQIAVLSRHANAAGLSVSYLKPHGALYNRVVDDLDQARAVLDGSGGLPVMGLDGGVFLQQARAMGRVIYREGFCDRVLLPADSAGVRRLQPRHVEGSVLHDPAEISATALTLAAELRLDSLCVHGDSPGAVVAARRVREALLGAGYTVQAPMAPK